jgi:hypothetical protein
MAFDYASDVAYTDDLAYAGDTLCPDGIVCRPSTGVIDRPGPLD